MTKKDAIKALGLTADLLELIGDNDMRAKAYQTAERALDNFTEDWDALCARGFEGVRGIGKQLAAHLSTFHATSTFPPLEELQEQVPPGVLELFRVRGLGPKKIRVLWDSGIASLVDLLESARAGKLAALKGFGAGSQAKILEAAEFAVTSSARRMVSLAEETFLQLAVRLQGVARLEPGGSLRRGLETIGDLDIVAMGEKSAIMAVLEPYAPKPDAVHPHLLAFQFEGMDVHLELATIETLGAARFVMTGSKAHLEVALEKARAQNWNLSSNGLFDGYELIPTPSESEVFRALELPELIPEFREPEHIGRTLPDPNDLVALEDMRGMLHVHTTYSDGAHSVREMALKARDLGMTYLGICDHSRTAFYANGLSIARVKEQWQEIDALNSELEGIRVLKGIESDILPDGSLDYPDDILERFDFIVASVHSHFNLSQADQTQRLINAVLNKYTTILGHPSGRLLLRRPPYEFDVKAVLEAARAAGTVVEINASPYRLDLDWRYVLEADQQLFAINTDAHSTSGYLDLRYGVRVARKGALTKSRCVNTFSSDEFMALAERKCAG
jgi:DNA polymerase (family X)